MPWTTPKTWASAVLPSADMNTYIRDNQNFLKTNIAMGLASALTVSGGVIAKTQTYHKVAGEGAADDEINTISGGTEGDVLFLRPNGDVITLKDSVDNIVIGHDIVLSTDVEHVALIYDESGEWRLLWTCYSVRIPPMNTFQYPNPGTDWTPQLEGAGLAASLSAKKIWLPLTSLQIGDYIISYKLVGDAVEAAAITLDCKLVRVNKADPLTTTDVAGGGITQITADGNFDSEATLTAPEVVATDKQYVLEILGTTGAGDAITVMGAEVTVWRLG